MESLQHIIDQIPIRHDLASHIMFLGIVQAYFLSLVIFVRSKAGSAIRIFGWALLIQAIVCTDTYLCYTGLMKYTLHANDSTEPLVLLIVPSIYFFTYALLERKPIRLKTHWMHFLLPVLYMLTQIGYYTSPLEVKLNAYLDAYHDAIPMVAVPEGTTYKYQLIKSEFRWLILISVSVYIVLCILLLVKKRKTIKPATQKVKVDKYVFTRNSVLSLVLLLGVLLFIFLRYDDDAGDHYIVIFMAALTFVSSVFILSESRFFENSWIADKYETLTSNGVDFVDIETYLQEGLSFLSSEMSLKSLASHLDVNANAVSKIINTETGYNFNDYINQKRIEVAKGKLLDSQYAHLTVEAIGQSVGFNSKSTFYNAFKKHVGISPTQFMKQNKG
ncbi:helix-turn-helix transcriptional regulator [Aureisphaera galaxeae]|uniref:helix-turn-helix domain-containing protein n=1 Tax=Aureisphaera galaxeae TaxID=1538023 RepID=UPI002350F910|nr:helix-turn-helix transcriptional regulator [Aureisphaera galaxeae]MDC8004294.1 helix-turn-helix transcriptional regulator [Aureisphaera galaxeae]